MALSGSEKQYNGEIRDADGRLVTVGTGGDSGPLSTQLPASLGQKAMAASLPIVIASDQTTFPVSVTFPATQPVSISAALDVSDRAARLLGHVTVDNFPATQPVSGTFWQGTQPVSLASAPTTPVTGTFWQATQPVSATTLPLPSGAATDASITNGNLRGSVSVSNLPATQPVSGTVAVATQGDGTLLTADPPVRRLLEQILLEMRIHNEQLAVLTGRGQPEYPENQRGL